MKMIRFVIVMMCFSAVSAFCRQGSEPDTAFYEEQKVWKEVKTVLTMDFSHIQKPESIESFHPLFHFPPIRQDTTSTCWSFSTTSFLESELYRIHHKKIKLSEMYTVYWEFVEKARRFVREKGNSEFRAGSEQEAVIDRIKQYGAVREKDYTGLLKGQTRHDHEAMFDEMTGYLDYIRENEIWDEEQVLSNIRCILDKTMGKPPEYITVDGKRMTPRQFRDDVLDLPLDSYVTLMSFKYLPFFTKGEYRVPDNWWHSENYYNVPLEDWYGAIQLAIEKGYSVGIGGDVSEPGKGRFDDIAVIPSFDIPSEYINQDAREFRYYNKTTTDDHALHIVGYQRLGDQDWFLVKDSGSSGYAGKYKGYYFFRGDWVKLKMMTIFVHRDAVKDLLKKIKKP